MTNLEQLAKIIRAHSVNKNGKCSCGETIKRFKNPYALSRHIAQAIHDAGWTGPPDRFVTPNGEPIPTWDGHPATHVDN